MSYLELAKKSPGRQSGRTPEVPAEPQPRFNPGGLYRLDAPWTIRPWPPGLAEWATSEGYERVGVITVLGETILIEDVLDAITTGSCIVLGVAPEGWVLGIEDTTP